MSRPPALPQVTNGVGHALWIVEGDYGAGAGSEATASAVISDLVDIARNRNSEGVSVPYLGFTPQTMRSLRVIPIDEFDPSRFL